MSNKLELSKAAAEEFELNNWDYATLKGSSPKFGTFNLATISLHSARILAAKGFPYLKKKTTVAKPSK